MTTDKDELDRYAAAAAVGAGAALVLSLVVPPAAIMSAAAVTYVGVKAYRRYGMPDLGRIAGKIINRMKTNKETKK